MQTTPNTLPRPIPPPQSKQTNQAIDPAPHPIKNNVQLLNCVISEIEATGIVDELEKSYTTGRRGYGKRALFRSYVTKFVMGHRYTNQTIRLLEDSSEIREICGFEKIPWHTTFTRFFADLQHHDHLIESAITNITNQLRDALPDLGRVVAVDSTAVHTYSNPNRKVKSDPEAKWGVKHTARGKDGKVTDWFYGYKAHVISDATYGIPFVNITTRANASDTVYLPKLIEQAKATFDWFNPEAVIADRGYDSKKNNTYLWEQNIHPIIKMKRPGGKSKDDDGNDVKKLIDGIYDTDGVPHCMGGKKMDYVKTDPVKGHAYVCPPGGCHLKQKNSGAMLYCDFDTWEDPTRDIRLFGTIRKASEEWRSLYRRRYYVERGFKSMKQARCLENHTIRGFGRINVHILMSILTAQATILVNMKHRPKQEMMWMVPRVA